MKTKVSLRLVGQELDPQAVSTALGCKPTESHRKGDLLESKRFVRKAPTGVWLLNSDRQDDMELAINELLDQVCYDEFVWGRLTERLRAEFFIGIFLSGPLTGFSVSSPLLKRVSSLGISMAFDIYS